MPEYSDVCGRVPRRTSFGGPGSPVKVGSSPLVRLLRTLSGLRRALSSPDGRFRTFKNLGKIARKRTLQPEWDKYQCRLPQRFAGNDGITRMYVNAARGPFATREVGR